MADTSGLAARLRRIQQSRPPGESHEGGPAENASGEQAAESGRDPETPRRAAGGGRGAPGPGWEELDRLLWVRRTEAPSPLRSERPLKLLTSGIADDSELAFLDTETTGLSGGAGTMAFLVGVGRVDGERFRISQYFLEDYPGEPSLIEALKGELAGVVVSYNGKSFDMPLLRSRFVLAGVELAPAGQIDLLHTARRLWRGSIGSCSLHAIEAEVLGVERDEDVPGYLVPELYFDYLRSGDPAPLRPVFSHHRYDILSLASLLSHIESMVPHPAPSDRSDAVELARLMLDRGMPAGLELLRDCAQEGSLSAARMLSLRLKRAGRWGEAVEVWDDWWERSRSYFAGVELAKYYEHRLRNYRKALEVVEGMAGLPLRGSPWAAAARDDIVRRRARLLAKLERQAAANARYGEERRPGIP